MTGRTPKDFAGATDPMAIRLAGMVRRFFIASTVKIIWRLTGVQLLDGSTEERDVEVFGNIGFYSRPLAGKLAAPEAIVVNVGDARVPVIVATRDAKGLSKLLKDVPLTAGDTVIYAGSVAALVLVRANGTVEVRTPGGTARKLAFHDELVELRDFVFDQFRATGGHIHVTPTGPTTTMTTADGSALGANDPTPFVPPTSTGTTVLKGQ